MDNFVSIFERIINEFTDEDDLMNFAATWGIQDSLSVRFRLFQLRNSEYDQDFVNEQLDKILQQNNDENVRMRDEIESAVKALLFDEEIEELTKICIEDGDWDPVMEAQREDLGADTSSRLQYTFRKKSSRTYAKNAAVDHTYQVKIDEQHRGQKLQDVTVGLHRMFEDVLYQARSHLAGNDLGRVVIHHQELHDAIVIPLQPWDTLNSDTVMSSIEKVLNSNQELTIDNSFDISVGSIELPKGGRFRRITKLKGPRNSLHLKTSVVTIDNEDNLCMARAVGVAWAKLKRCTTKEWQEITKHRKGRSNLELSLQYGKVTESHFKNIRNKTRDEQKQLAVAISLLADVPLDRKASLNDVSAFEEALQVRVMVVSARLGNKFITGPSTTERPCIYLYLVDDDHFHAISSITGFFSSNYFCNTCLNHYDHREEHQCDTSCIVCKRGNCPKTETPVECSDCNMSCRSVECYLEHKKVPLHQRGKKKGQPRGLSQCLKWWKCPICFKVLRTDRRKKEEHECGEYWCSSCQKYVMDDHQCYLRAKICKKDLIPKFIFFDFECSQDEIISCQNGYRHKKKMHCKDCQPSQVCTSCSKCQNCNTSWCGKATHRPNYVVAQTVCPKCIHQECAPDSICRGCGTRCEECENVDLYDNEDDGPCPGTCGFREVIFQGQDTAERFGQWLFSEQHSYFKVVAHNGRAYDTYFLLEYLIDQSMRPDKIIYNGSKIMYMKVELDLHIKVIDSLNFLPMKLSQLPKAFGLEELKKGWFPHYFNIKEHQNYIGPYPSAEYYGHDFMSEKERNELLVWLRERKNDTFDFRKEMEEYCRSDVDILRQACMKFRELLMGATGEEREVMNEKGKIEKQWVGALDPFDSVTIASVCMNIFRTKFLEEEWRVQINGRDEWIPAKKSDGTLYVKVIDDWVTEDMLEETITSCEFVKSPIAKLPPNGYTDQYSKASIQWLEWRARLDNVHIQHALNEGEKTIPGTRYKLDGYSAETHTAYEYHGCVFHGCPVCFSESREETCHPLTKKSMKELYALTLKKKAYLEYLGMKYVSIWDHDFKQQIDTNEVLRTFIQTLDLSERLDPRESFFGGRTNASQLYYKAKEQEQIKYVDFTSLYPWVNKYCQYPVGHPTIITKDFGDIKDYFGVAKVKILPPRGLYHPVLPYRSNGKLKFPLCRTCADTENTDPCSCSEAERVLTGTWCTPEIHTALRLGYQVQHIYEVYHWEESTQYDQNTGEGGLFAKYIDTFLKFKQEASGPPDWIKHEQDMTMYIQQYKEREGISLDRKSIVKNAGLRALAKLCLNSFWGKFGQRLNLRQTDIFHESQVNQFFQLFSDPVKQALNFHILTDDMIQIEWIYKRDCQPEDNNTNVYLATFTTCWARLKLYSVLEQLDRRVLYYDTDSVIYVSKPGEVDPPLGDYLGELTDELENGEHIVEFVSGGPKNYAYKTNVDRETCKVRGFTLNYTNSELINFESIKQMVTNQMSRPNITITNPSKICRDKRKRTIFNREEKKSYQMVYTKRRRLGNFDTVPYGY